MTRELKIGIERAEEWPLLINRYWTPLTFTEVKFSADGRLSSDTLINFSQKWCCSMKILLKIFFSSVKYLHRGGVHHKEVSIDILQ